MKLKMTLMMKMAKRILRIVIHNYGAFGSLALDALYSFKYFKITMFICSEITFHRNITVYKEAAIINI